MVLGCPALFAIPLCCFSAAGWLAATSSGLFVSPDTGASWHLLPFPARQLAANSILAVDRQLWATTSGRILYSIDAGRTWHRRDLPPSAGRALRLTSASARELLATAETGLFISHDFGVSWKQSAHGLPAAPPENVAVSGQIWIAAMPAGGLYITEDQGESWNRLSGTIPEGFFPVLAGFGPTRGIFAASATEGLFALELNPSPAPANNPAAGRR